MLGRAEALGQVGVLGHWEQLAQFYGLWEGLVWVVLRRDKFSCFGYWASVLVISLLRQSWELLFPPWIQSKQEEVGVAH